MDPVSNSGKNYYNNSERSTYSISNQIALNATLAAAIQVSSHIKPGNAHRFINANESRMEHYLSSSIALNIPMGQLAQRGIMVERGLIDIDEVDMGWIIGTAAKEGVKWQSGGVINLGMLFLFSPIAAAAGYLLSKNRDNGDEIIDLEKLPKIAVKFIENTTPEDTVNIFSMLHDLNAVFYSGSGSNNSSLPESVNEILEAEINLKDFYNFHSKKNYLFKELSDAYPLSFSIGISAFNEAINEGKSMIDAISHTYVNLLSINPDSKIYQNHGKTIALKVRQKAKYIVEFGGYLTKEGCEMTKDLEDYLKADGNNYYPETTADLTANVTFLATLSGIRP